MAGPVTEGAPGQSMEAILASIKRIITDDSQGARAAPPAAEEDEDVLELGEAPAPAPVATASPRDEALMSDAARSAARQALASLAALSIDPKAADNTLDGLVRDMLRPMLKQWLDANLPELVERIVAREVARVVGR